MSGLLNETTAKHREQFNPMPNQTDNATPRPWIVSHTISQPIIIDGHKCVAEIVNDKISNFISRAEAEANAALIVKAVNEHDALNAVAEAAKEVVNGVATGLISYKQDKLDQKLHKAVDALAALRS